MIKVFTEFTPAIAVLQTFIRSDNNPYVDIHFFITSYPFEFTFLDHAQQRRLHFQ